MAGITINPAVQTNVSGFFSVDTTGQYQGVVLDDPGLRYQIAGGIVDSGASTPMWGGIAVTAKTPTPSSNAPQLGQVLSLATTVATTDGFTVYNQGTAMIMTPQSRAPLSPAGGAINYVQLGCGLRLCVACDSSLATSLEGESISTQVQWDYTNQKLIAYSSGTALPVKIERVFTDGGFIVNYASGTGFANWTTGAVAIIRV